MREDSLVRAVHETTGTMRTRLAAGDIRSEALCAAAEGSVRTLGQPVFPKSRLARQVSPKAVYFVRTLS